MIEVPTLALSVHSPWSWAILHRGEAMKNGIYIKGHKRLLRGHGERSLRGPGSRHSLRSLQPRHRVLSRRRHDDAVRRRIHRGVASQGGGLMLWRLPDDVREQIATQLKEVA